MTALTARDFELVALGAAMGSNCISCIEYHIPEARKAGLTDEQIRAAIGRADRVRQTPARKVMETAMSLLDLDSSSKTSETAGAGPCAGASVTGSRCGC